jgi:DNA mismatch repair protein MutS
VARLAGMPPQVLNRADAMLKQLEDKSRRNSELEVQGSNKTANAELQNNSEQKTGYQLSFIQLDDPTLLEVRDAILDIDIDTLTPLEALLKLNEIKKIVKR